MKHFGAHGISMLMEFRLICGENSVDKISENWDRCMHKLVSHKASTFEALDSLLDMLKPSQLSSPPIISLSGT